MEGVFQGRFGGVLALEEGTGSWLFGESPCVKKKIGCEGQNPVLIPSFPLISMGFFGQRKGCLPPMAGHGGGDGGRGSWGEGWEVKVSAEV